jgi:hypothetical protein
MVERSNGTKLFMGWEGATLLAPHQGWSRDRLQSTVRAMSIAGQTPRVVQMRAQNASGWWGAMPVSEDPRTKLSQ